MNELEPYYDIDIPYNHSHRHQFDHLGLTHIADRLVFLQDCQLRLNLGAERARDVIRRARQATGRLPVLCLDLNPCDSSGYMDQLQQVLDPGEYFVLDPDIRPERSVRPNQAAWPCWLLAQQMSGPGTASLPRCYRISMLSGSMRYHRMLLWRAVRDVIRADDVVVMNRMGHFESSIPPDLPDRAAVESWQQDLPWANDLRHADHPEWVPRTSWQLPPDQGGTTHAAFRACVNITNETGAAPGGPLDQCLLSEKTWKAYRSGCLVVNYGALGAAEFLASQGIGIWSLGDPGGTHAQYVSHLRELWQRDDIWDQHRQHKHMIEHNRDLVMSRDFALKLAAQFLHRIESLL